MVKEILKNKKLVIGLAVALVLVTAIVIIVASLPHVPKYFHSHPLDWKTGLLLDRQGNTIPYEISEETGELETDEEYFIRVDSYYLHRKNDESYNHYVERKAKKAAEANEETVYFIGDFIGGRYWGDGQ